MSFSTAPVDTIGLLYHQHQYYTAELAKSHHTLSKLYKKLAHAERALAERQLLGLTRSDKKKWQWSRSLAKKSAANLESQVAALQSYLRECNDMIAAYEQRTYLAAPMTPWTGHLPPSPYLYTPFSATFSPWSAAPSQSTFAHPDEHAPRNWDLSMRSERRQSSPYGSSADSGFYEPPMYAQPFGLEEEGFDDPGHVYAHELMSPISPTANTQCSRTAAAAANRKISHVTEAELEDAVPEMCSPVSPAKEAFGSPHRRRYSENAVHILDGSLRAPMGHNSGRPLSWGGKELGG